MAEEITINKVSINENRIDVIFDIAEELKPYFCSTHFWIEYSEDISKVPQGIAVIPFVCNVLPIIWLTNAKLSIQELDKTFNDSIPMFKQGYINMYPMLDFKGDVNIKEIIENNYKTNGGNAAFFSGGVDAFTTLICHREELPTLITLRGSDVQLDDIKGWNKIYNHLQETVHQFDLPTPVCITSNFRTVINTSALSKLVVNSHDGWWHGFQHGIGIISQVAPVAYIKHFKIVYIASSNTKEEITTCASDPSIDNYIKFGSTSISHDKYELNRQQKVKTIVDYCRQTNQYINTRVCWVSRGGSNCCRCEKCLRTMYAFMAECENPSKYGFNYTDADILDSRRIVQESLYNTNDTVRGNWKYTVARFKETEAYKDDPRINWVYTLNPYAKRPNPPKPSLFLRIGRKIKRIFKL